MATTLNAESTDPKPERDLFELVTRAANVAYYEWVPGSEELHFSRALRAMFGYDPGVWTRSLALATIHPDDKADYLAGIRASFNTTFRNAPAPTPANRLVNDGDTDPGSNFDKYIAANMTNGLVDWDATTTPATDAYGTITSGTRTVSTLEKILTQKYLAENTIAGTEAWDDFRRTLLPQVPISIQASVKGQFPKRLLYPQSEVNTNKANVPLTTTQYDRIFWVQL